MKIKQRVLVSIIALAGCLSTPVFAETLYDVFKKNADVNRSGGDNGVDIDTVDLALIQRNIAGFSMEGTAWVNGDYTGDVNCDGEVDTLDIALVQREVAGFPISDSSIEKCENLISTSTGDNVQQIYSGSTVRGSVPSKEWRYYKITSGAGSSKLDVNLKWLQNNVDLYVRKGSKPNQRTYDCSSARGGSNDEICSIELNTSEDIYIGVFGYQSGSYGLVANLSESINAKKAVLLLHGLNSSSKTWDDFIDNNKGFDGKCTILTKNTSSYKAPNSEGVHCFNMNFGYYDKISNEKDYLLYGCKEENGCNGDYSTFSQLGDEVRNSVLRIESLLGSDVEIILLGHSRGGLAARAFLQDYSRTKAVNNIKGLITTGTPHLGSPFGRLHNYIAEHCIKKQNAPRYDGRCLADWVIIDRLSTWFFLYAKSPSIKHLSETSDQTKRLNNKAYKLPHSIKYAEIVYEHQTLGNMFGSNGNVYNPFPSVTTYGDLGKISDFAEEYIIDNPNESPYSLHGDGIVPFDNQHLSNVDGASVYVKTFLGKENTSHLSQTKRHDDLSNALNYIYNQVKW